MRKAKTTKTTIPKLGGYLVCHLPSRLKTPPVVVAEVGAIVPVPG